MEWKDFLFGGVLGTMVGVASIGIISAYYFSPIKVYDRVIDGKDYRVVESRFGDKTVMENNETYQKMVFTRFDDNTKGDSQVEGKKRDKLEKEVLSNK